jgi:K+-transporting ATPase c subunit
MKKTLMTAVLMTIATTILLGLIYPLVMTGLAQVMFHDNANGQLTTSASGFDPDITPAAAEFQVPRIAKERGLSEADVRQLVAKHTQGRTFGLLGESRVNVLQLNLDLDAVQPVKHRLRM